MAGTRVEGCVVVRVVDGDTVRVALPGAARAAAEAAGLKLELSVRAACLDTEESLGGSPDKPVTEAGRAASAHAKSLLPEGSAVALEFDTDDPLDAAFLKHQDNFGRLLAYVHAGGMNLTLEMVSKGHSPYFVKYGRSRPYHADLLAAEAAAQAGRSGIWDPLANTGGPRRDYGTLLPWWGFRDSIVHEFRDAAPAGVLSVRLDHAELARRAKAGGPARVFADLQGGARRATVGYLVRAGSPNHPLDLVVRDAEDPASIVLAELVSRRYAGTGGRGYAYVEGRLSLFREKPQLELADLRQVTDTP